MRATLRKAAWKAGVPLVACVLFAATWGRPLGGFLAVMVAVALVAVVIVAVHHAEVVALRVGEPFGTLVLALAVTVIESGLILSVMLAGAPGADVLARDTVFATVMIVCNGVVGLCLLAGAIRHHTLAFRVEGTNQALSVLAALVTLTLVLPSFTTSVPGPVYSAWQLAFAGVASLFLYAVFVFVQTVRHRDYFLPVGIEADGHAAPPATSAAWASFGLLLVSLVAVIGLAKVLSPNIQSAIEAASAPAAVLGIVIALIVLLPESMAAARAALRNRMQTSLNLALGSALATIGLTIPAVAALSIALGLQLELGLPSTETVLLALTLVVSTLTFAGGSATVLQGAVHLVLFAAFLFLALVP